MGKLKPVFGILLIIISLGALVYWEVQGRDAVMMETVLVAKENIKKGEMVNRNSFNLIGIPKENLIEAGLSLEELNLVEGKIATQFIAKNDQILVEYFLKDDFYLKEGESVFVINPEWIAMRSSSLRRGDLIDVYTKNDGIYLGAYKIAYVKDSTEREVISVNLDNTAMTNGEILQRPNSSASIDHIEIICTLEEYKFLISTINADMTNSFIIVQRGEKLDS